MTGKGFILFSVLLLVSDVASELVDPRPLNKAVVNGATRVAFNCSSSPDGWAAIGWNVLRSGESTQRTIANGGSVFLPNRDAYEVSNAGDFTSTLIIKTVNETLAGTYICTESGSSITSTAQLIVYSSEPVCTSNVSPGQNLTQGQSVQMSCSFSYTATSSSVGVNMVWSTESSSTPVKNTTVFPTDGRAVSTNPQTVGYSSPFPVYQCQTSFKVNGTTATNDPGYLNTAKPYSSPINVLYFNPNCSITEANSGKQLYSGDRVYYGTGISCVADANPSPSYRWSNGTDTTLSNKVQITNAGEYTCTASNSVGSCTQPINLTVYNGSCDGLTFKPFVMIFVTLASIAIQNF